MFLQIAVTVFAAAFWYQRFQYDRSGAARDMKVVLFCFFLFTPWSESHWTSKIWMFNLCAYPWSYKKWHQRKRQKASYKAEIQKAQQELPKGLYRSRFDFNDRWSPMKPVIFPCRTAHTRLFPKKHSFSYSYLFVGIPVGWRGYISTILSADLKTLPWSGSSPRDDWFNVDSANHLARGENIHGLQGKLEEYLVSQHEKIEDYPFAYLITAPAFLGYSFNPVSFWYLYDSKKELRAMILEVNNTFDERRLYFLKNSEPADPKSEYEDESEYETHEFLGNEIRVSSKDPVDKSHGKFSAVWPKDFHVSPFNSRKGTYSLSATDPFVNHLANGKLKASCGQVNNTITLSSSKEYPKLIARVFSTSESIDPYSLSEWQVFKFVLSWCWVGFVTFPRIVREAGKLFFRRKLHVWYRPEVLEDSLGRKETDYERAIAVVFKDYVKDCVESSKTSIPVQFSSCIATMPPTESFSPHSLYSIHDEQTSPHIVKVTTPLFYSQIARSTDIHDCLKTALSDVDPKTSTFYTSHPNLLLEIFKECPSVLRLNDDKRSSILEHWRWAFIKRLRSEKLSSLDRFAQRAYKAHDSRVYEYRRAVCKVLVSDRLAFGIPGIIDAVLLIIRLWLCWICVQSFASVLELDEKIAQGGLLGLMKVSLGCVGLHLWAGVGSMM